MISKCFPRWIEQRTAIKWSSEMEKQISLFFIFQLVHLKSELVWTPYSAQLRYTDYGLAIRCWVCHVCQRMHHISLMMSSFIAISLESLWSPHAVQLYCRSTFMFTVQPWCVQMKVLTANLPPRHLTPSRAWTFQQHSIFSFKLFEFNFFYKWQAGSRVLIYFIRE